MVINSHIKNIQDPRANSSSPTDNSSIPPPTTTLPHKTSAKDLLKEYYNVDQFKLFLDQGFVSKSLRSCDNFYRHVCPVDIDKQSAFMTKNDVLMIEVKAKLEREASPEVAYFQDFVSKIAQTSYSSYNLTEVAQKVHKDLLDICSKWDCYTRIVIRLNSLIGHSMKLLSAKIDEVEADLFVARQSVDYIAQKNIYMTAHLSAALSTNIFVSVIRLLLDHNGMFMMFIERTNALPSLLVRQAIQATLKSDKEAFENMTNILRVMTDDIRDTYKEVIKESAPLGEEDRFGMAVGSILSNQVDDALIDLHVLDIALEDVDNAIKDLLKTFNTSYEESAPLQYIPLFRFFVAYSDYLFSQIKNERFWKFGSEFEASTELDRSVIINEIGAASSAYKIHVSITYGAVGLILGHELQHVVQMSYSDYSMNAPPPSTNAILEANTSMIYTASCHNKYYGIVCNRFPEKRTDGVDKPECSEVLHTHWEDDAGLAGHKVAERAYRKRFASELTGKAYQDLNFTNEQLFYYSNAIIQCMPYNKSHWRYLDQYKMMDTHNGKSTRTNAIMASSNGFRALFHCNSGDRMVIDEDKQCNLYRKTYN